MDFVVSGVITQVMQPQSGVSSRTGQPWQSQEYVLTYEQGQYPKSLCFRVFGTDKLQQFAIQQGEQLTVHLNITCQQSRNGGYFNSVDCWKVDRQVQQAYVPQQAPMPQQGFALQQGFAPQPMQQAPMAQQFPPQVNAQGQPMQQAPMAQQYAPQQAAPAPMAQQAPVQNGGLPFPPAQ